MEFDEWRRLKVSLQSLGARVPDAVLARSGGAGPAEGVTVFMGGLTATVPTTAWYVAESPFSIVEGTECLELHEDGRAIGPVEIAGEPRYCGRMTEDGTPFGMLAVRHGRDAIGSTVAQWCVHGDRACAFCGIDISLAGGVTVPRKDPGLLAEVARAAEEEGYSNVVLTTGTTSVEDAGIGLLAECAAAIGDVSDLAVHVQFEPPADMSRIAEAARFAVSAAVNIESFDEGVLARVAPAKSGTGLERYVNTWKAAVDRFGAGQVTSFVIVGMGESRESVLDGCRLLASMGVYPFVLPLRPIPGTRMEKMSPPPPWAMADIYREVSRIIESAGLRASDCLAGCVRCGACSAITDWGQT